jgi:hypothetical protein
MLVVGEPLLLSGKAAQPVRASAEEQPRRNVDQSVELPAAYDCLRCSLMASAGRATAACSALLIAGSCSAWPALHHDGIAAAACRLLYSTAEQTLPSHNTDAMVTAHCQCHQFLIETALCCFPSAGSGQSCKKSRASNVISGYTATLNQPQHTSTRYNSCSRCCCCL